MAESPSSRPTKVTDIENGEVIQVGDNNNNNVNNVFQNCIINITNYYNQPPPPTSDTDHTTEPYLRQVQVEVKNENGPPATAPGRPRDQGPASHAVKISTQTVVDIEGRVLEPGDVVWIGNKGNYYCCLFVGDGMVVTVDKNTRQVVKVPLDVEEPFSKCWAMPSLYREYNSVERVQRATRRVGQVFDGHDFDFAWWCFRGQRKDVRPISSIIKGLLFMY